MRAGFMMRLQGEEEEQVRLSSLDRRHLRLLGVYLRPHLGTIVGALAAMVTTSAIVLALPLLLKTAVDRHIASGDLAGLVGVVAVYIGLALVQWLTSFLQSLLSGVTGQNVVHALRRDLHEKVLRHSLSFFHRERVGEVMSRITNDITSLSEFVSTGIVHVLNDVLTLTGVLVMMFVLDARLAAVTCVSIPVIGFGIRYLGTKMRESYATLRREVAAVNVGVQQGVSGMRVTQSMAREQSGIDQFEGLSLRNMKANIRTSLYFALLFPLMSVSNMLSTVLVLAYGGSLVGAGAITVGTLFAFFGYINRFFGPVREMSLVYNSFQGAAASLQRVAEYLEMEPDLAPAASPVRVDRSTPGRIVFENVAFVYPNGVHAAGALPADPNGTGADREAALRGVDLRVESGETIAIVGPTGAGKTTLAMLLARMYDPTEGRILIDDVDLRQIDPHDLRRIVSLVTQEVYLFPDTIEQNIRYGRLDATDEEVREAARLAQASAFIEALSAGYETAIGESGTRLSGGQKQLLSLARTILADPRILILDEPTASVDVITESLIQQGLARLTTGRTTLIIAHRFSTVKEADRIVLVERGRVSGVGAHEELIAHNCGYRELYEKQWAITEQSERSST
ncbi:MAG: ABC transporter ATP-binding protein [Spirochaetota bacterium]